MLCIFFKSVHSSNIGSASFKAAKHPGTWVEITSLTHRPSYKRSDKLQQVSAWRTNRRLLTRATNGLYTYILYVVCFLSTSRSARERKKHIHRAAHRDLAMSSRARARASRVKHMLCCMRGFFVLPLTHANFVRHTYTSTFGMHRFTFQLQRELIDFLTAGDLQLMIVGKENGWCVISEFSRYNFFFLFILCLLLRFDIHFWKFTFSTFDWLEILSVFNNSIGIALYWRIKFVVV